MGSLSVPVDHPSVARAWLEFDDNARGFMPAPEFWIELIPNTDRGDKSLREAIRKVTNRLPGAIEARFTT